MTSTQEKPKQRYNHHHHSHRRQHSVNQNEKTTQQKPLNNHSPNLPSKPTQVPKPTSGWAAIAAAKSEPAIPSKPETKSSGTKLKPSSPSTTLSNKPKLNEQQVVSNQQQATSNNDKEQQASLVIEHSNTNHNQHHKSKNSKNNKAHTASNNTNPTTATKSLDSSSEGSAVGSKVAGSTSSNQQKSQQKIKPLVANFNREELTNFLTKRNDTLIKKAKIYKESGSDWSSSNKVKKNDKDQNDQRLDAVAYELSKYLSNKSKSN